jgi:uncharacterized alkaline shock family protein YloU
VPAGLPPGRSIVTKRAAVDLIRAAVLGSYGVTGLSDPSLVARLLRWTRRAPAGIRLELVPRIEIELWITVAWGLPVAEVARQVDSAVRYSLRRALAREVDGLVIHVNRLRVLPGGTQSVGPVLPAVESPAAASDATAPR